MAETAGRFGMAAARVGAVVLALGALVFFVVRAQVNATGDDPGPAPAESGPRALELPEYFLPSSKSEAIVIIEDEKKPAPEKSSEHFLRSSKSLSFDRGELPGAKKDVKKTEKKKPEFLPSTKSGFIHVKPKDKPAPPPQSPKNDG